jgi:hypothetical protein
VEAGGSLRASAGEAIASGNAKARAEISGVPTT